ncbi:hypothetical protein CCR94_05270 [Rhodoblastus sphagnicola]|uniref:Uncharacterized protein n=1 Tax=Rhodoblastus sphagnicola TaxID=333368 RepID=A0A2S6ND99_9HYPH|nr:hypothetical protein [Rhodoblastus sphagnicola]MBB4197971.1 transcriptional regulator with XRE-family HTH domain [Rhodoblastus sphagnicola]PPQ32589.1 hypothetical protein CCR94_05270 [Rhodoblastus sphagnicola]
MTKLAQLMTAKDLKDRELADLVGAPELEIWRLRKGPLKRGQKMTLAWAHRLAAALDVEWSALLDEEPDVETVEIVETVKDAAAETTETAAPKSRARPSTRNAKSPAVSAREYVREQEPLSRDDLRVIHGIVSACALSCAPNVRISAEAFRNLVERAIENAAYGHSDLSTLADRIASWLAPGAGEG